MTKVLMIVLLGAVLVGCNSTHSGNTKEPTVQESQDAYQAIQDTAYDGAGY